MTGNEQIPSLHSPVMINEVLYAMSPRAGAVYVDGTFGRGGYSRALMNEADCQVVAIDRDPDALDAAQDLEKEYRKRFKFVEGCFGQIKETLTELGHEKVDGIVLDLGVSSPQIDQRERGFSFQSEGPLDMRMSRSGLSAADVVNTYSQEDIANILYQYGEEKKSRAIARKIVERRSEKKVETTLELANLIRSVIPDHVSGRIHPATRTFQALRIYVNQELEELEKFLEQVMGCLKENGRLVIVSFHSLEDRLVKKFFAANAQKQESPNRNLPLYMPRKAAHYFIQPDRKGLIASEAEVQMNPRSRSARLRWGILERGEVA
ncbi:MAG: 16S rRNA (cytosine(1402)-N(4))-methyltransferase [Rickettsiales bacterium]|nr:16S rRNA (cytosine(1402)-N(4))-methyltransferase [Rickettsiales bacterium]|tara:strand:- start:22816 stop:23778 length:963 start_codon:yes stop_codon:yes gene_type:complete